MNDERRIDTASRTSSPAAGDPVENTGLASARSEHIGVGSGDENVAKIQLAARWSEMYAPESGDSIEDALRRFRRAYMYVDSVSKAMEPEGI